MQRHRIMVAGSNVITVQRVSRYCLEQRAEVFPYYGIPSLEEIALFMPEVVVFCAAIADAAAVLQQLDRPCLFWLEEAAAETIGSAPIVSTAEDLRIHLQKILD